MRTDASRFERVETHPDFGTAPAEPVLPADAGMGLAALAPMSRALFALIAITVLLLIGPSVLALLLVFVAAIGFGALQGGIAAIRDAPTERVVAVIVKERSEVHRHETTTSTSYHVTLQTRDGTRTEYRVARPLVGRLVVDDIGVAYVKDVVFDFRVTTIESRRLVEFIRFDVD